MRHLTLIMLAALCLVSLGVAESPAGPQSKPARTALDRYSAGKARLDADYQARLSLLSRQLIGDLTAAVKSATKSGDLKEANAIQAVIDQMETEMPIQVISAMWGAGDKVADVTTIVAQAIASGTPIKATSGMLNGDPAPMQVKKLAIVYRSAGGQRTVEILENQDVRIP